MVARWGELNAQHTQRSQSLVESLALHTFYKEADEQELWIEEQQKTASDECYKDTSDLEVGVTVLVCSHGRYFWNLLQTV